MTFSDYVKIDLQTKRVLSAQPRELPTLQPSHSHQCGPESIMTETTEQKKNSIQIPSLRRPSDLSPCLLGHLTMDAKEKQLDTLFLSFRFAAQRITNKAAGARGRGEAERLSKQQAPSDPYG